MAWVTDFISVHLLAQERHLLLQPVSFASTLSIRNLKSLDRDLDKNMGAPRYTASFLRLFKSRICFMALLLHGPVCFEKKIPDLDLLMLCPDHKQYFSRQSANLWASFLVALEKRIMSSAYMTCVMAGPLAQGLVPLILLSLSSLSKNLDKTSCPRMNKYGESRSPCLKPLLGLNRSVLPPLTSTSKGTELCKSGSN